MKPGEDEIRRRTLTMLAVATAIGSVGLAAGGTAGALLGAEVAGTEAAAGLPLGLLVAGQAIAALVVSRRTRRAGPEPDPRLRPGALGRPGDLRRRWRPVNPSAGRSRHGSAHFRVPQPRSRLPIARAGRKPLESGTLARRPLEGLSVTNLAAGRQRLLARFLQARSRLVLQLTLQGCIGTQP